KVRDYLGDRLDAESYLIEPGHRGVVKQALIAVGYPAEDLAGYTEGAPLTVHLRELGRGGLPWRVRDYQRDAADVFYAGGDVRGRPAAAPGVPGAGEHPGAPPARHYCDPHRRGRPRGGRVQPDRPQEVRRALARAGAARLDRRGHVQRGARGPARAAAHGVRRR